MSGVHAVYNKNISEIAYRLVTFDVDTTPSFFLEIKNIKLMIKTK